MPNNKKASGKKKEKKVQKNLNNDNLEALKRLSSALSSLGNETKATTESNEEGKIIGYPLSHWRELNEDVNNAYKMLFDGAELIRATSTKYTLVGKIDINDGSRFSEELRQGCELISTGALLVHEPSLGCSRPLRKYVKRQSRSVVMAVLSLIDSFVTQKALDENIGAQKTGVIWSACDEIMKIPKGNRACIRRDIFTWVGDCNESMQEFQEMVAADVASEHRGESESSTWDDFCANVGTGEEYTHGEAQIVRSCLAIIKCSRGSLNLVLKAFECAGTQLKKIEQSEEEHSKGVLQWISNVYEYAKVVGENVTDLGMLLYPPIDISSIDESDENNDIKPWMRTEIGEQIQEQADAVKTLIEYIQEQRTPDSNEISIVMSEEVNDLASKLSSAITLRRNEAEEALKNAFSTPK